MRVRIAVPRKLLAEWDDVLELQARGEEGSMGILPRRLDFVSHLVPGIVAVRRQGNIESYAAVDGGILVKAGDEVTIASPRAVRGESLEALQETLRETFLVLGEREKEARTALASLEARFVRRFVENRRGVVR